MTKVGRVLRDVLRAERTPSLGGGGLIKKKNSLRKGSVLVRLREKRLRVVGQPGIGRAHYQDGRPLLCVWLLHDERDVVVGLLRRVRLRRVGIAQPGDVDARAGVRGYSIGLGDLPATIEQVVRAKAQAVPARRVCRGVVVAESRHLGVLETRPTYLPGGMIDDASGPQIPADIR